MTQDLVHIVVDSPVLAYLDRLGIAFAYGSTARDNGEKVLTEQLLYQVQKLQRNIEALERQVKDIAP